MKNLIKKLIIVILWIGILNLFVMLFYGFFFENDLQILKDEIFFRIKYYSRKVVGISLNYDDIKDDKNNVISENNISVKISNIDYEQVSGKLKLVFNFYTNDKKYLDNICFILRIYDSQNIFYSNKVGQVLLNVDNIDNLVYNKNLYNKLGIRRLNSINAIEEINTDINNLESVEYKSIELKLDLGDNYTISDKLNVEILDLLYEPSGDFSYKAIEPLGEFKFTIKFY